MSSESNIKVWQLYKLEKGQWIGLFPYGYKSIVPERCGKYCVPGEVVIIEEEKKVVESIFLRYSKGGISLKGLQQYIKENNGVALHVATIHRIILNAFYKGIMTWKGMQFPHHYPTIITPEIFDLCQNVRKNNYRDGLYEPATDSFKKNPARKGK